MEGNGRLPPQSRDAERCVLGSMLRDNAVIGDVGNIIHRDYFYVDAHQKIYEAIAYIYDQGLPVDIVVVAEHLESQKLSADIGGLPYLGELWEGVPTAANAEYYARIVRDKAIVRNLIHTGNEILRDAYDNVSGAEDMLETAERKILDIAQSGVIGQAVELREAMQEAYDRIDARANKELLHTGVMTGFTDLDELTAGLHNNELVLVAARPSIGKTAFALNVIRNVILGRGSSAPAPVFFVSLEQSRTEIAERLLIAHAKVDSHKMRKGYISREDMDRLMPAMDQLSNAKLFIDDTPQQSMLRIAANARRLKKREKVALIVIDYLQLIDPENKRDSRQEQVAQISRRLKFLARELKLPVIALAQVNRTSEDRGDHRPRLADLRESGSLEQDADTVMMLHRPGKYEGGLEDNIIELIVAKQRNGPTGDVNLSFVKDYMLFENHAFGAGEYS